MSITFRETSYIELWGQGYPQESIGQQVTEATRVFLVPWEDRFQARLDFLGYSTIYPVSGVTLANGATGTAYGISRITPDFHPGYQRPDGSYYLFADNATFEPFGMTLDEATGQPAYGELFATIDSNNEPVYEFAKMTVHYSSRLYNILDDSEMQQLGAVTFGGAIDESTLLRYIEIPYAVGAQYLTLPDGTFLYASPATDIFGNATGVPAGPVPGSPGKIEGQWDVTMIWRQVPRRMIAAAPVIAPVAAEWGVAVQSAAFDLAIGRVNSQVFAGYPPGTLLCEPPELTQWVQSTGEIVFDVTFHFKYFRQGWNYFLAKNANATPSFVYTEVSVNGNRQAPNTSPPVDGVHQYDAYPFKYLFYGYDYSAGYAPAHI